jgi:hypothetical protein
MQKVLLLISITFFSVGYAQYNRFEVGIESGPAFGKFWGTGIPATFYQSATSYTLGSYFRINLTRFMGIQTGLYTERLSTSDDVIFKNANNQMKGNGRFMMDADYISFPVLAKFNFGNRFKANFSVGTFFSYLTNYTVSIDYKETLPMGCQTYDYTNLMNRFNTGLSLGAGLDYVILQRMKLGVECKDQLGLYNISRTNQADYFFGTNSFQVLVRMGYMFGD